MRHKRSSWTHAWTDGRTSFQPTTPWRLWLTVMRKPSPLVTSSIYGKIPNFCPALIANYHVHIRLLHTRIVLYRPMLCRMYSERASLSSLSGRFTKEGAIKCLETAQKIVRVVLSSMNPDVAIGILPWWYRIYYLHMAGTHFLAAMCTSDLYADSIAESWHTVLSALRSHEHLSEYVKQCVATFESLSVKILQARCGNPNVDSLTDAPVPLAFDDIFQEMGIDFNQFLFSQDDTFSNII